jgi:hypothetical protein
VANVIADLLVKLGIDVKGVESGAKKAGKATSGMSKGMAALRVGALAGAAALAGVVAMSIREYAKAEIVVARLAGLLKNMQGASVDTLKAFQAAGSAIQSKTGFGDDEVISAMTDMLQVTKDYNVSLQSGAAIADFAAGANIDLSTSAMLLGRAYNGDTTMLKRYGVTLAEGVKGTEALEAIQKQFAGSGAARLNTLVGQYGLMKNNIGDNAEMLGKVLAPVFIDSMKLINKGLVALQTSGALDVFKNWIYELVYYSVPALVRTLTNIPKLITGALSIKQIETEQWAIFQNKLKEIEKQTATAGVNIKSNLDIGTVMEENAAKLDKFKSEAEGIYGQIQGVAANMAQTLVDNQATANEKMSALLKTGLLAVIEVIGMQLKAYMVAETAKAINTGGLTGGTILAMAAQIAAIEGLKAAVGTISLAQGGIAYSPVNAVVGDNPTSPEVVAPLHTLQNMINKSVSNTNNKNTMVFNLPPGSNRDYVRREIVPELDAYLRRLGKGAFRGAY